MDRESFDTVMDAYSERFGANKLPDLIRGSWWAETCHLDIRDFSVAMAHLMATSERIFGIGKLQDYLRSHYTHKKPIDVGGCKNPKENLWMQHLKAIRLLKDKNNNYEKIKQMTQEFILKNFTLQEIKTMNFHSIPNPHSCIETDTTNLISDCLSIKLGSNFIGDSGF